jgi:hypothetical protein
MLIRISRYRPSDFTLPFAIGGNFVRFLWELKKFELGYASLNYSLHGYQDVHRC